MIRAVIVDDELHGRETLKDMLVKSFGDVEVVGIADSASMGVETIQKTNPDIVFLDIHMPNGSGFDLLKQIPKINFEIIFTTAYDQYALKAIKVCALDYLLKPIDTEDLEEALIKFRNKSKTKIIDDERLKHFIAQFAEGHGNLKLKKIGLPTSDGSIFVDIDQILRLESESNYTRVYLNSKETHLVSRTLKDFEDMLISSTFIRIHHAHIININYIKKYVKGDGGYLIMTDNSEVEVSRRKKEFLLRNLVHL